jgi:hypothetical protein
MADNEIAAMQTCTNAIESLEDDAPRRRVLSYLNARFGVSVPVHPTHPQARQAPASAAVVLGTPTPGPTGPWQNFGDLFYAFRPTSNSEKALVAGYWLQMVEGKPAFKSNQANQLLKDLGEQIPHNIQRDYDRMIEMTPSLVVLQAGSGAGRRLYKLTLPGIQSIQSRVGQ